MDLQGKGSASDAREARTYVAAMAPQQKYLNMLLTKYVELKRSWAASCWFTENPEGCTLGLAMVWKLQVGVHLDCKDWELCMIVCSGNFTGGALYLPDLDLCLA